MITNTAMRRSLVALTLSVLLLSYARNAQATTFTGTVATNSFERYAIPSLAGDNLVISLSSVPDLTTTQLELFDPNGNLVAIASGNASDGLGSVVNYTVLFGGTWAVDVLPSPVDNNAPYAYTLSISGNSGGTPYFAGPTPEPSSLLLLGTGALGIFGVRRKLLPHWKR